MNLPPDDLDRLADERLDGYIDDDAWTALEQRHGNALAIALHQAHERRAAVAALPRPVLSDTLRAQLLPPAPAPLRFPWRMMATVAVAACLVILVLPRIHVSDPIPSAPSQASEEKAAPDSRAIAKSEDQVEAPAALAAPQAPEIVSDELVLAELAETARTNATGGSFAADAMLADAPGPHAIALAWAPRRRDTAIAADSQLGRSEPELRQRTQKRVEENDLDGQPAPAAAFSAPAEMEAIKADMAEGAATTKLTAATADAMVVVLHNRTVSPWTVAADQMRLQAHDASGAVVWEGRVDAIGTLTVAPGGFLSLTVDRADWPPTTRTLRAVLGDLVSAELSLEPLPPE